MRLNKFISESGATARRGADAAIAVGRVRDNGVAATLGTQVEAGDAVELDGRPVAPRNEFTYIALNKPVGVTCTTERHVEGNIIDFVKHPQRIFPVGRLDKDSEGLIVLTNNGDIVNELLRVENHHEKEYVVTVDRPVTDDFLRGMAHGVDILETRTLPCAVRRIGRNVFGIILTQGLNRQIRRMCAAFEYRVWRLQRVRINTLRLDGLAPGQWRDLRMDELRGLLPQRTRW